MTRWHSKLLPELKENVMVQCTSIIDTCIYCILLEYDRKEAMIPLTEITRQRIRSLPQIMSIGRVFVASVISIDLEKEYIDISKKRVTEQDIQDCELKYKKSRKVNIIVKSLLSAFEDQQITEFDLYSNYIWKLKEIYNEPLLHELDILYMIYNRKISIDLLETSINKQNLILKVLDHHCHKKDIELQCEIELTCFSIDGIEGIKQAIREGLSVSPKIQIKLLRSPLYILKYITNDKEEGIQTILQILELMSRSIRKYEGSLVICKENETDSFDYIKVMNADEHYKLQERINKFSLETEEIDGDDEEID
jgi:translation initiation factor 2 subunit 1